MTLILLIGATSGVAFADDPSDAVDARAQELYDNGAALYDEGRYEDAVAAWQEAYGLSHRPLLLYNMANAEERLARYQEAADHLDHYRAYATLEEREPLDRRIYNLQRRLDAGLPKPGSPAPPEPAALLASSPVPAPLPLPVPLPPHRSHPAGPVLLVVGAVGAATGATFGGMTLLARGSAGDDCVTRHQAVFCPASVEPTIARDRLYSLVADAGFVVGIVGGVGGSIALATRERPVSVAISGSF